ncbi:hypothetical protein HYH03_010498 [Edaphochlamys debaryana]|uniref:Uncharacterized protein n=1 Tax=Edaphochlamys debaryana TaxID=47281 RepID=A0A836BWJ7_9CHLO|nr:hypothetical protein HYH03_010498 [Edaphochlamys debaryana]|eukprot:KAG2491052.1 hypothetical protein HYH03_010498 [Edaphochlamys debaryana]
MTRGREVYEGEAPGGPGGAFNMLRYLGNSRHMSSGFVSCAVKAFTVSACSAAVFGTCSYMLLGTALGPVLPFMGGAAFGFVGGLVHRQRTDLSQARLMAGAYPRVIEHHLGLVEPGELQGRSLEEWSGDICSSLRKQGLIVAALYSAADTIQRLQDEQEERIVQAYYAGAEGAGGDS